MDYIANDGSRYIQVAHEGCSGCAFDTDMTNCSRAQDQTHCETQDGRDAIWVPAFAKFTYTGKINAQAVAFHLVGLSTQFSVIPGPFDTWEFSVCQDVAHLMPKDEQVPTPVVAPVPMPAGEWLANPGQIETTDVDVEATAWAIATLEALHVDCMSTENAAMMERLRKMTGA